MKWTVELIEHDIHYKPRTSMKGQGIADFLAKLTLAGAKAGQGKAVAGFEVIKC